MLNYNGEFHLETSALKLGRGARIGIRMGTDRYVNFVSCDYKSKFGSKYLEVK